MISIIPIPGIPIIQTEEELWEVIISKSRNLIQDGDILVCAHTPFSRVMGYKREIKSMIPSSKALQIAKDFNKDPNKIEVVLQASKKIVKLGRNVIISENRAGVVCANAGVDESNAELGYAVLVPDDPDKLAADVRAHFKQKLGVMIAVIISDTVGRALRRGAVNIGIGTSGIPATKSEIGKKDLFGYEMRVSEVAIIDEIASAAELVQGQTDEGVPFVIIRGYRINFDGQEKGRSLNRPEEERLFK